MLYRTMASTLARARRYLAIVPARPTPATQHLTGFIGRLSPLALSRRSRKAVDQCGFTQAQLAVAATAG